MNWDDTISYGVHNLLFRLKVLVERKGNIFPIDILNAVPSRHVSTLFLNSATIDLLGLIAVEYLPTVTETIDKTYYGLCFNFLCEFKSGKIESDKFKWVELKDDLLSQYLALKSDNSFGLVH